MANGVLRLLRSAANRALGPVGFEITHKITHDWGDVKNYIPFESTLAAAREAKLSVGDYIDSVMNGTPGATANAMKRVAELGVFSGNIELIVEIGPGTGRYLEKTLQLCRPARYEVYETAPEWARYVATEFGATVLPTDGETLKATANESANVVQAHKVLSATPFLTTVRYWMEMVRVTRPGGYLVFDLMTEDCADPELVEKWGQSAIHNGTYPAMVPKTVVVDYFAKRGFRLVSRFLEPMGFGKTEMFVFQKSLS